MGCGLGYEGASSDPVSCFSVRYLCFHFIFSSKSCGNSSNYNFVTVEKSKLLSTALGALFITNTRNMKLLLRPRLPVTLKAWKTCSSFPSVKTCSENDTGLSMVRALSLPFVVFACICLSATKFPTILPAPCGLDSLRNMNMLLDVCS